MRIKGDAVSVEIDEATLLDLIGDSDPDLLLSALLASCEGEEVLRDGGFVSLDEVEEDRGDGDEFDLDDLDFAGDEGLLDRLVAAVERAAPGEAVAPEGGSRHLVAWERDSKGAARAVSVTGADVGRWLRETFRAAVSPAQLTLDEAPRAAGGCVVNIGIEGGRSLTQQAFDEDYKDLTREIVEARVRRVLGAPSLGRWSGRISGWAHVDPPEEGSVEEVSPVALFPVPVSKPPGGVR